MSGALRTRRSGDLRGGEGRRLGGTGERGASGARNPGHLWAILGSGCLSQPGRLSGCQVSRAGHRLGRGSGRQGGLSDQLGRRLRPRGRILGHAAGDHVVESHRHPRAPLADAWWWLYQVSLEGGGFSGSDERDLTGEALEQHRGQRVAVAGRGRALALDLLRRGVVDRADELAGSGQALGVVRRLDQAEVGEVGMVVLSDQDVLRLDVPVDEPGLMGGIKRLGNLGEQAQRAPWIELVGQDQLLERGALDQAHRQEEAFVGLAGFVDGDDVLMVQPGLQLSLALEASAESAIIAQLAGQQLQGHDAVERELGSAIDGAHATGPEHAVDAITRDNRASRKQSPRILTLPARTSV